MRNNKKPIIAYEFSTLYIEGQTHKEGDIPVDKIPFDNLWDFILSNKASDDTDVVMSVHTRGGRRYIKTGRYVGTIQTRDGQVIEVLPKMYKASGQQEEDKDTCRRVFLNMLRHFTDAKARSFQNASLSTKKGFPILEVYISNYINGIEQLVLGGLMKNYTLVEENQTFLKGKLDVSKQITKNVANKVKFAIRYNKYIEDIPHNRILVTTLRKLMGDSHNTTNKARINALLTLMADIPYSTNIENDLRVASASNRLFSSYDLLIKWSSQFLLNRGFTTFAGSCVNQSLLFQAEKLFEDFIAFLFKKYAPLHNVNKQNNKFFLVDRHNGDSMFRLRPDIVVESQPNSLYYNCIIIDTKWKAIDETKNDAKRHYLIDIKDMYQMYAYGQKYGTGESAAHNLEVVPKLVLIYPYSEKFTDKLPEFQYEEIKERIGLNLMVVPFDLTDPKSYESQVSSIIESVSTANFNQPVYKYSEESSFPLASDDTTAYNELQSLPKYTILVGCYKSQKHLEWIKANKFYNIRFGQRKGAINKSGTLVSATKLVVYNKDNPKEYCSFQLDATKQIFATNEMMKEKDYPNLKKGRDYLLYVLGEEIQLPPIDIVKLREHHASGTEKNAPFFVTIGEEFIEEKKANVKSYI